MSSAQDFQLPSGQASAPPTQSSYPASDRKYFGSHRYKRLRNDLMGEWWSVTSDVPVRIGTETFEGKKAILLTEKRLINVRYGPTQPREGISIFDAHLGQADTFIPDTKLLDSMGNTERKHHVYVASGSSGQDADLRFSLTGDDDTFKPIADRYNLHDAPFLGYHVSANASEWKHGVTYPPSHANAPLSLFGTSTVYFADPEAAASSTARAQSTAPTSALSSAAGEASAPSVSQDGATTAGNTDNSVTSDSDASDLFQWTAGDGTQ
ncbi:hypothetical protein I317_00309 [Kwoniella heveanensis CBS 569]|nr:hypothetical protein I317_00309 [Kwoniella heveanensis CBS 569]